MFSVDNFYTFMHSRYGFENDGRNILFTFRPHGSKDWKDLYGYFLDLEHQRQNRHLYDIKGSIILHDQEPFDQYSLDIYKKQDSIDKKEIWRESQPNKEVFLTNKNMSLGWPIFCHSELNSRDIDFVRQAGGMDCHYFWHGLIARDWFRHWKHHACISPDKSWSYKFLLYARDCSNPRQYRSRLINDLFPIRHTVNYDWNQESPVAPDYSTKISVPDSQTSAVHLVAETLFDRDKIHLTEKIFKPMVMMQPFIVFAEAGSLQYLKNYGFQTFSDIWDESYDQITDHAHRYQKILDLIHDLNDLEEQKFNLKMQHAKSIVVHNHQRFFSNEFEDQMLKEITDNMDRCLAWQDEKTQEFPGGAAFYVFQQRIARGIESVNLKERLSQALIYLQKHDCARYWAILRQHGDLCNHLV